MNSTFPAKSTQYDRRDAVIGQFTQALLERRLEILRIARAKQGRVFARHFFGRTAIAEVIQCQGFSGHAFGALQRIRMPMIGEVRRAEDHYAVENRQYFGLAVSCRDPKAAILRRILGANPCSNKAADSNADPNRSRDGG